ncbi:MAG: Kdo(2)-lipid lauroyltransferase [Bacteroidota bacterium]|jgi:KDO2-lipid IV(A) lauroyltransferase
MINLIKIVSKLPLSMLYGFSNFVQFILIHLYSYRNEVIEKNLTNSFPDKSRNEILQLRNKFYAYFTDTFIEFIKGYSITKKEILKRIELIGDQEVQNRLKNNQSVILVAGHQGNWEWAIHRLALTNYTNDIIYQKLSNKKFNDFTYAIRTKFKGINLLEKRESVILTRDRKEIPRAICLLSDQAPQKPESAYWTHFLNQETAFFTGMERFAREYQYPVFYVELIRTKRGFYQLKYELIADLPFDTIPKGEIIERFARKLEKSVENHPDQYLWSHRRWKHQKPIGAQLKWD